MPLLTVKAITFNSIKPPNVSIKRVDGSIEVWSMKILKAGSLNGKNVHYFPKISKFLL
jgi:hypothetical protein